MPAVVSFPRGGRSKHEELNNDASTLTTKPKSNDSDFLFSTPSTTHPPTSSSKRRKVDKQVEDMLSNANRQNMGGGNVKHDARTSTIEGIGFSRLDKGMKLLGVVNQVVSDDLVTVSLPNALVGYVMRKDASFPPLSLSLPLSSILPFAVLSVSKTEKRVELSPHPTHVNRGLTLDQIAPGQVLRVQIDSEEDHGWSCSLGMAGVKCFFPRKNYTSTTGTGKVVPGMVMDVSVTKTSRESRMVTVTNSLPPPSSISVQPNHVDPGCSGFSNKGVRPGMLVRVDVEGFARNGILVGFLGGFKGCVAVGDLKNGGDGWKEGYKKRRGDGLVVRVVLADSKSKTYRLSEREGVVGMIGDGKEERRGERVRGTAERIEPKIGVWFRTSGKAEEEGGKKRKKTDKVEDIVFVHVSELGIERKEDAEVRKKFQVGTEADIRILGHYRMDDWLKGSLKPEILNAKVLGYGDIVKGERYRGVEIVKTGDYGVVVKLGRGVNAMVTNIHLKGKNQSKVGGKLDVKALTVDVDGRRCMATARRELVKEDMWSGYGDMKVNDVSTGFITKVDKKGITVTFVNNTHGVVNATTLAEEMGVEDPCVNYKVGEVVKARFTGMGVRGGGGRMGLSLDLKKKSTSKARDDKNGGEGYEVGDIIVEKELTVVKIEDGEVVMEGKGGTAKCGFEAFKDTYKDPDEPEKELKKDVKVGKKVKNEGLVVAKDKKYPHTPIMTFRKQIVEDRGEVPSSIKSLTVGDVVTGWVANKVDAYGAFVRFMNHHTALVPALKGGGELKLYDTVRVKISRIDKKGGKILCTIPKATTKEKILDKNVGAKVGNVEVVDLKKDRAYVKVKEGRFRGKCRIRVHMSMYTGASGSGSVGGDGVVIPPSHPFSSLKVGSIISDTTVASADSVDDLTYIDLTNLESTSPMDMDDFEVGMCVEGVVEEVIEGKGCHVRCSPGVKVWGSRSEMEGAEEGDRVKVVVTRKEGNKINVSGRKFSKLQGELGGKVEVGERKLPDVGETMEVRVTTKIKCPNPPGIMVELREGYTGRVCVTELAEDWENMPLRSSNEKYKHGQMHTGTIISNEGGRIEVSLRGDDAEEIDGFEVGGIAKAFVVETNKKGCFLRLGGGWMGKCLLKDLADTFVADPIKEFPPGRLVAGYVGKVDGKKKTVNLNLRESKVVKDEDRLTFEEIEKGDMLPGVVTRIESYGVFVKFVNSDISGLVHISELNDEYVEDIEKLYTPGDVVKAVVLSKVRDGDKDKLSLGLKESYFGGEEDAMQEEETGESSSEGEENEDEESESEGEGEGEGEESEGEDNGIVPMDEDDDGDADGLDSDDENFMEKLKGKMEGEEEGEDEDEDSSSSESEDESDEEDESDGEDAGFNFGSKGGDDDDDASDSDEEDSTKRLRVSKKDREAEVSRREELLASGEADANPQIKDDFERLLAGAPNDSETWIRYMAFYISSGDNEAARAVSDTAAERIDYTKEEEKTNVYMARITMELEYGTEGSFLNAIQNACRGGVSGKKIMMRTGEVMEKALLGVKGKKAREKMAARLESHFENMCKKNKSKKKVWLAWCAWLVREGKWKEAREVLKRALLSLGKYKHVEATYRFASIEFEFGSAERARTIFEGLMDKNLKKLDLWFVYVDKEVKFGSPEKARRIFERITGSDGGKGVGIKKDKSMKAIFKKWYGVEERLGGDEGVERVKGYAEDYVSRSMG